MTIEYWVDEGWFVGRLRGVAGVFSQAETLRELEANIREAYRMMSGRTLTLPLKAGLRPASAAHPLRWSPSDPF